MRLKHGDNQKVINSQGNNRPVINPLLEGEERADLHMHTTVSDGMLSPTELVYKAAERGLKAIAITDHDTVGGVAEAQAAARDVGIECISGIEFSSVQPQGETHILAYFVDPDSATLQAHIKRCDEAREQRIRDIAVKLNALGLAIKQDDIFDRAGGSAGRVHVAQEMVARGYVTTVRRAFVEYLAERRPAYVPKWSFSAQEACDLARKSGGVAVLAHPGKTLRNKFFYEMIQSGLDGVEIVHPSHSRRLQQKYAGLAHAYKLLMSGGSDYHGSRPFDERNLGTFTVPLKMLERLRERAAGRSN